MSSFFLNQMQAAQTLFSIVRDPEHRLQSLDVSCNEFAAEHFELMRLSLSANKTLTSLDMRHNPGYAEATRAVTEIERHVHHNEILYRRSTGHP